MDTKIEPSFVASFLNIRMYSAVYNYRGGAIFAIHPRMDPASEVVK